MTTIAYDGVSIASDSMAVSEWKEPLSYQKIYRDVGSYDAVGFCGDFACLGLILDWLADPEKAEYDPLLVDRDFAVLCVRHDGQAEMYSTGMRRPLHINGFYAIGSGSQFAMAAMMCGCSAEEAVRVSIRLDLHTGGKIVSHALRKPRIFSADMYEAHE